MSHARTWTLLSLAAVTTLLAACGDKEADRAPAVAPAPAKVQAGQWRVTTEMTGPLGQQSLAGMEQALKQMTPEQRKAAHMDNARIEGGKLVQEVCITPEMAGRTLQSIVDAQAKDLPGCAAPEIQSSGQQESLVLSCGEGRFRMSLQADYASPTENTVRSSTTTPGGTLDSTVRSQRIGDC
ncbi:hypothetical protein GCM10027082_03630 [Comamonas humi]